MTYHELSHVKKYHSSCIKLTDIQCISRQSISQRAIILPNSQVEETKSIHQQTYQIKKCRLTLQKMPKLIKTRTVSEHLTNTCSVSKIHTAQTRPHKTDSALQKINSRNTQTERIKRLLQKEKQKQK